jgi:S-adenosylmethionine decarboxylase proenzyme
MDILGRHVFIDGWGVAFARLDSEELILSFLEHACNQAGATILHSWVHRFEPQGVTALVGLAESHASIHTYPEIGAYFVDMFTCGDLDPRAAATMLVGRLGGTAEGWFWERGAGRSPVRLF